MLNWLFSHAVFYPTYCYNWFRCNVLKTWNWWDRIDEHVIVGALPSASHVPGFHAEGVTGVVNTCEEYGGPVTTYDELGIEQFRMPTIDFTHPKLKDVQQAVEFIEKHAQQGGTVYVHCKAGRARSATVAICWLIKQGMAPAEGQQLLLAKRKQINPRLTERPVVIEFAKESKAR